MAKAVTEHLHLGQDYSGVKKIYSISILYFDIGVGTDYLYHGQNQFVGVHTHDHLQVNTKERGVIVKRLPSEIFPEYILVRVNEFDKEAVTPLEEWVRYLKDGIITSETTAPGLEEAREKLRYYSMSPEERYAYDEHLNAIMIQNDVLSTAKFEGWEEGRVEERLETARRMRSDGLSMEMVVRYTGLSEEEINNL
jgi:predicted transposase/invertase (TIGR01784 family)